MNKYISTGSAVITYRDGSTRTIGLDAESRVLEISGDQFDVYGIDWGHMPHERFKPGQGAVVKAEYRA